MGLNKFTVYNQVHGNLNKYIDVDINMAGAI